MRPYIIAIVVAVASLFGCRHLRAETWQQFVATQAAAGLNDMQIRSALIRPGHTTNTVTVIQNKDPAVVSWEQAALLEVESFVEVVTGTRSNALARVGGLSVPQIVGIVRQAKAGASPERRAEINDRSDALMVLFIGAKEKGYSWPLPEDFGQATKTVQVQRVRPGRSRWDLLKPVGWSGDPPSLDAIRKEMSR
jgi:hypothetical protein